MNFKKLAFIATTLVITMATTSCTLFTSSKGELNKEIKNNTELVHNKKSMYHSNFIVDDRSYIVDMDDTDFVLGEETWPKNKISIMTADPIGIDKALSYIFNTLDYNIKYIDIVNGKENIPNIKKRISFSGNVKSYINFIEYTYDVNIKTHNNDLVISFYEQKTYKLSLLSEGSANQSSSFSLAGGTGGLSLSQSYESGTQFWEKLEPFLDKVVKDGHYFVMPGLASLVVVTRPSMQRTVESILDYTQDESTGQVIINYQIYELDKEKISSLAAELKLNTESGSMNLLSEISTIIGSKGQGTLSALKDNNQLNLQAVLEKTSTNIVSEGELRTLSNRVVPVSIVTETAYVSSVQRASGDESTNTISQVTPEVINTGMSLMFMPRILDNNIIHLETGFNRSTLGAIENFEGLVQLPIVNRSEGLTTNLLKENTPTLVQLFEETRKSNNNRTGLFGITDNPQQKNKLLAVIVSVKVLRI